MTAYAVAIVRETQFGPAIREYLERIDETLTPFSGVYRVHGGPYQPLEGEWSGDMVIIEFPSMELAKEWYESPAYSAIRPLRINNTVGEVFLVQGVPSTHKGADLLG